MSARGMKGYRTEMNHVVRRTALRTRDYLDDVDDVLVGIHGRATKLYRRILHADQDCVRIKRKSGS